MQAIELDSYRTIRNGDLVVRTIDLYSRLSIDDTLTTRTRIEMKERSSERIESRC